MLPISYSWMTLERNSYIVFLLLSDKCFLTPSWFGHLISIGRFEHQLTLWITYGSELRASVDKWYPQITSGHFSFHLSTPAPPHTSKLFQSHWDTAKCAEYVFFLFPTLADYFNRSLRNGTNNQHGGRRKGALNLAPHQ